ncbi:MAG TPA: MerR family transcriptional regulator [Streptosporangiaceae bacterium]|jgi:DNA-binding transcriptional MerR regulator|nr:MerR family transcriptional regulator [Streptosporangiaceae bacterium]
MSAQPARAYYGIGEVLAQLSGDFPDVRISKIRFLEAEGLIEPARSPSGYRRFSRRDVERLRYILTAQRDQYLPLRVIKERLDSPDGAVEMAASAGGGAGGAMLSRKELLEAAGIDGGLLDELEEFGLVRRRGRQYGQDALAVARLVGELGAFGVQARHLRVMKTSAERETSLIEQVVAPLLRQRSPGAIGRASQTARDIAALSIRLHAALVEAELGEAGLS